MARHHRQHSELFLLLSQSDAATFNQALTTQQITSRLPMAPKIDRPRFDKDKNHISHQQSADGLEGSLGDVTPRKKKIPDHACRTSHCHHVDAYQCCGTVIFLAQASIHGNRDKECNTAKGRLAGLRAVPCNYTTNGKTEGMKKSGSRRPCENSFDVFACVQALEAIAQESDIERIRETKKHTYAGPKRWRCKKSDRYCGKGTEHQAFWHSFAPTARIPAEQTSRLKTRLEPRNRVVGMEQTVFHGSLKPLWFGVSTSP
ncbi:hypothetical protein [Primorskyibacter sp. S187A]|uniref:hypothetical protein n=1 Tax=Primorskyibacter sp. S187A TaxID=3415130 RepID=UPI003C7DBD86